MKKGWEYKKLKDVATFTRGLTYSKNDEVEISNNIVLRSNNVDLSTGKLNLNDLKYLRPDFSIPEEKKVKKGCLLMCMSNGSKIHLGKVALINKDFPYAFGGFMALVTPNQELNPQFFYYSLSSPEYKDFIKKLSAGANINNIKVKELELFTIPVPPLSEQQSIVDYLDAAFAKIDAMKANAEKALNEAKALFQASLKEMLEPKEGWEEKTLKEVCTLITDGTHHSPPNDESGKYKYITAKNIKIWGLDLSNITYVSEDIHKEILARCNPQKGDVLYIKDGATTGIAIVNPLDEEFSMLSSVALLKPNKDVLSSEFLCFTLNSPSIYNQTRNQMDGAAITRVTLVKIKGFVVSIPPLSEQQRIVATLDSLKSKVDRLQANFEKISQECDALKQAILRQIFE